MAAILSLNNNQLPLIYLSAYHCFGRSINNVNTLIEAAEISRSHALIEWLDQQWVIRDISHNGTWVNNQKLTKDSPYKLTTGDEIYFANAKTHGYIVKNLSPPQNMLINAEATTTTTTTTESKPIILTDYNLLPSEQHPEIALFYVQSKNQWYKEFLNDVEGRAFPVANEDIVRFDNQNWQLSLNSIIESTVRLLKAKLLAHQINYRFNLTLDEENTQLNITTENESFNLSDNAHHYLTLSLARHRDQDAKKGFDHESQGWRFPEILAKELGYEITLFNTHVCRAKKQFREMLDGACSGDELIERKGDKIRFAGSYYRIYKGSKLIIDRGQNKVKLTVLNG
ncbi:MAG: FHA domain-containing protein [Colwellia sp.]|nr:FHA domain-containing protein [Colwellia sp.]